MARTRTIRRSSSRVRRKSQKRFLGFLPEGLQAFIARRLVDIFAAALCLSGVFVLFALLSYDHQDPSWNSASTAELNEMPVRNWMGHNGAWTADLFLQTVGIGGFLYGIILLVWGVRSFLRQPLSPLWLRIIALAFAGVCCSVAFAQIPSNGWTPYPYMGSSVGKLFMDTLGNWGNAISPWMGPVTISVIAAILTLATALYAGATQLAEIGYVTDKAYNFLRYTCLFALALGQGFTNWLRHHNDPDYRPDPASLFSFLHREEEDTYERAPRPVRKQPRVSEDDSEEDEEDEDEEDFAAARMPAAARPAARAGAIPVVKAQAAKIPQPANVQQRFSLSESQEDWEFPPLNLLESPPEQAQSTQLNESALQKNAELLQNVLMDYNIEGDIVSIHPGHRPLDVRRLRTRRRRPRPQCDRYRTTEQEAPDRLYAGTPGF